jgi:hypothetical protein
VSRSITTTNRSAGIARRRRMGRRGEASCLHGRMRGELSEADVWLQSSDDNAARGHRSR